MWPSVRRLPVTGDGATDLLSLTFAGAAAQEVLFAPQNIEIVLEESKHRGGLKFAAHNPLAIPIYLSTLSAGILLVHTVWKWFASRKSDATKVEGRNVVRAAGGFVIYGFRILRLFAVAALLAMQVLVLLHGKHDGGVAKKVLLYGLCGVYAYSTFLALLSVTVASGFALVAIRHLCLVLVATLGVFVYRDLWPLATYTLQPKDAQYGILLWVYMGVLTVAAVVVPLCVPRPYVPLDFEHPSEKLHPEQTASILSRLIYTYMDPLIFSASRVEHLAADQLPPLPDYDQAENLIEDGLQRIGAVTSKKWHIFFGLMSVFRYEYTGMFCMVTLMAGINLASPIGVNRLLAYIETDGEGATIQPWFWILWIFLGPFVSALALQYHVFLQSAAIVRGGAIVTQLVFNHALKIRVKADTRREPVSDGNTAAPTPDAASVVDVNGSSEAPAESENPNKAKQPEGSISGDSTSTKVPEDSSKSGGSLIGKLNNLVTSDWTIISNGSDLFMTLWHVPLQLILCIVFLYVVLGWAAFVGLAVTALCLTVPGYFTAQVGKMQAQKMELTDSRVQSVTETMNIIRMVKMFGWEPKMSLRIAKIRNEELVVALRLRNYECYAGISNFTIPFITMIFTYGTYSVIMKRDLSASIIFSSMAIFDMIRRQLWEVSGRLPPLISAKVSLDRLNKFLYDTELLDEFTSEPENPFSTPAVDPEIVGFKNATFSWDNGLGSSSGASTPGYSRRKFRLEIEDELTFKRGHINLIIGPTGTGKTSILMALLGEMHYVPMGPDSYFSLPRDKGIAYASQESWVQNETIRDNILFGTEYNEERYKKVIEQCGLKRDLELFEAGDQTEVGEKGLTLSGGQKARVTLARAVYSKAEILLLDDVLAALDVHTSKWIVDKCFKGDLIRGRTVLLVTHNIALASPIAEFVVAMGKNGRVSSHGSLSRVLAQDKKLSEEMKTEAEQLAKAEAQVDDQIIEGEPANAKKKADGKLVVAEEIAVGHVSWKAVMLYMGSLGGKFWWWWWAVFVMNMTVNPAMETFQTWYLGYWAKQYEDHPASEVSAPYYLSVFTILITVSITGNTFAYLYYYAGNARASRIVHQKLLGSILASTMRWLDITPISRVINRCTQDMQAVDFDLPRLFIGVCEIGAFVICKFGAIIIVAPAALFPGFLVALAGTIVGRLYLRAQLSVKREQSIAQAPILSHFGAAMAGLVSIRAYGAQKAVKLESFNRINRYTKVSRTFRDINRWMSVRVEAIGALFSAGIAAYLVYMASASASNTGFALNMAVGWCEWIRFWIYLANQLEVQANSLERIQQYLEIEHEPEPTPEGTPPAYWPASGKLSVEKLSAKYSTDGPKVLHELNFDISSGERVGIVGRTGSGKSSLTLALLRCILTEGQVTFDGLPTNKVNLDALRSSITIIPQVPELLSGTLRQNLDPFEEYDDAVLNDALRSAGLFSLQTHEDEARLTLDSSIASGGGNLSVGQRQIIALARAMVRRSKLLILDEATSAIDNETDNVIQASLRTELDKDVTLLTIAHRLQTIMDADKIMVLDAGRIVEFGAPKALLQNEKGVLRALVDDSGDKENLYAMVAKE